MGFLSYLYSLAQVFAYDFNRIVKGLQSQVFIHKGANFGIQILVFLLVTNLCDVFNRLFYDGDGRDIYSCLFIHSCLQTLDNGVNVVQLETAVGAAIKSFEGAIGEF